MLNFTLKYRGNILKKYICLVKSVTAYVYYEKVFIYTSGKKKQCIFKIAVYIEECEGNAKLLLHSCIIAHSKKNC